MSTEQFNFQSLFDGTPKQKPLTGKDLRDAGIDSALARAERIKSEYVEGCLSVIKSFPRGYAFTSEDVRAKAGDIPRELNHSTMAGILKKARAQGLIGITGKTRPAQRSSVHAKSLCVWWRL